MTTSFSNLSDMSSEDRTNWKTLSSQRSESAPFVNDEWTAAWLGAFVPQDQVILCVHENEDLVGLACLVRETDSWAKKRIHVLKSITNNWSYRYEFLAREDRDDIYLQLWRTLLTQDDCDAIWLDWVPERSPTMQTAGEAARELGWSSVVIPTAPSPWRHLPKPPAPWDEGLKSKFKSNLRNRERRFKKEGEVEFEVVTEAGDLTDALRIFYELEASGWKGERGTAIQLQKAAKSLFEAYIANAKSDIWIPVLSVAGKPVAAQLIRVWGQTMFLLKTAYNPDLARYSPGQLITARTIQHGIAHGMQILDFLGVPMTWKTDWAPELRANFQLALCSPSATGRYAYWMRYGLKEKAKTFPGTVRLIRWLRDHKRRG